MASYMSTSSPVFSCSFTSMLTSFPRGSSSAGLDYVLDSAIARSAVGEYWTDSDLSF